MRAVGTPAGGGKYRLQLPRLTKTSASIPIHQSDVLYHRSAIRRSNLFLRVQIRPFHSLMALDFPDVANRRESIAILSMLAYLAKQ